MEKRIVATAEDMGIREIIAAAVLVLAIFGFVGGWQILPDADSLFIGVGLIVGSVIAALIAIIVLAYHIVTAPPSVHPIRIEDTNDND